MVWFRRRLNTVRYHSVCERQSNRFTDYDHNIQITAQRRPEHGELFPVIMCGRQVVLGLFLSLSLWFSADAAGGSADLEILPAAFLTGVTKDVQLTCRPPPATAIADVITIQVTKTRESDHSHVPLASYVTTHSPVAEALGVQLGASVSGHYDPSGPAASFLLVTLHRPGEEADGEYSCEVNTLDPSGMLHSYSSRAALLSLARNESVPTFYQTLLRELRHDLDSLTSDLDTLQRSHLAANATISDLDTKLSAVSTAQGKFASLSSDLNTHWTDIDNTTSSLQSQLSYFRTLTPDSPVNFHACVSGTVSPSDNSNIVFNVLSHHTADNAYSTSTGFFTVPTNGTYFFQTGITGRANTHTYASLTVSGEALSSVYAFDDYYYNQAMASAVVELRVGETVSVLKKSGGPIEGSLNRATCESYFLGTLLW
ncbi:uncharacterized protein LOC143297489 [Babylonia areolata]|uniref:uncharacterized protein LOC143297489 n=1 Tax=Babylonia areolata TaxID=304850 RepID=UPI003FD11027